MMLFIIFLVIFLITKGFLSFNEETLIILATIFWFDAAGALFKSFLDAELIHKVDVMRQKFLFFLALKKKLLEEIRLFHYSRINLSNLFFYFRDLFFSLVVLSSLERNLDSTLIRDSFSIKESLYYFGDSVQYDKILRTLEETLSNLDYASTEVRISPAHNLSINNYNLFSYKTL